MKTETLTGTGPLFQAERLVGTVRYRIQASSPEGPEDGLGRSSGTLTLVEGSPSALFQAMESEPALILHLADGRRWPCVIDQADGETAHALGDGLIYQP